MKMLQLKTGRLVIDDKNVMNSQQAAIADIGALTQAAITVTGMTGTAGTPAAETNLAALTLTSMTGTANTTPAADTVPTKLTGTLTGTVNGALVDVAAAAGACAGEATPSATNVDSAIATAVATIVSGTNEQLKELQTSLAAAIDLLAVVVNNNKLFAEELVKQRALNTVLINDAKSFATRLNEARADIATVKDKVNADIAMERVHGLIATQ